MNSDHAGMGGPNIAPEEDGPIATCVANAPGGPVHVLVSDEIAEHIPGCNMSFRRSALLEVEGFDPIYRAAGDDVDLCWRIQDKGYTIGFHPSAFVWHHRRNSIKAYWRQQKGYGKAEALLEGKWPEKYNGFGHVTWGGRIYGNGLTLPIKWRKDHVFHGTWGSAPFQSVYQRADSFWAALPLMPEWYLFTGLLAVTGLLGIFWHPLLWAWLPFCISAIVVVTQAAISASANVSLPPEKKNNPKYRLLIIYLHLIQPAARLYGRITHGLTPWRKRGAGVRWGQLFNFGARIFTHWSESWHAAEDWLSDIEQQLSELRVGLKRGGSFHRWDLQASTGLFAKARCLLTIEEHGGGKQFLRFKCWPVYTLNSFIPLILLVALSTLAAIDEQWIMSCLFCVAALAILLRILADASNAINSLRVAVTKLSGKVPMKKMKRHFREIDRGREYQLHNYVPEEVTSTNGAAKEKVDEVIAEQAA
jgi:hypothetical protein